MTRRTLGQELGEGSALFVQNLINRQDQVLAQQQQQEVLRRQAEQQALDNTYRQTQADTQAKQWQDQFGFQQKQWGDQRDDVNYNRTRQTRLDGASEREDDTRNYLAPLRGNFQQGIDADAARYAPTLKDGRPNPQYDRAMHEATILRGREVQKLWGRVVNSVGSGAGFVEAKQALLDYMGEGEGAGGPVSTTQPISTLAPTPIQLATALPTSGLSTAVNPAASPPAPTVPSPFEMSFAPVGTGTPFRGTVSSVPVASTPASPASTPANTSPAEGSAPPVQEVLGSSAALPARVQDIPPSRFASFSDDDLQRTYGRSGLEYARAARAEYAAQIAARKAADTKVRVEAWQAQLGELAKRDDLTGEQRLDLATITSLMARTDNLSEDEATQLVEAFKRLTPKTYTAKLWQDILASKDPGVILAQYSVYKQYAPQVVEGFDPAPLQRLLEADLDYRASQTVLNGSIASKNEADTNETNRLVDGKVVQQGAELLKTEAETTKLGVDTKAVQVGIGKTLAETRLIGVQVDAAKQKAGLEGIDTLASLPTDLSYYQMTQGNPALVGRIKNQLGLNDQGMANLWRQAQYKYGLGLTGEELKNDLSRTQITNTAADTLSKNAQRGLIIAQTEGRRVDTLRTRSLLPGEVAAQPGQRVATAAQARAADAAAAASYANANRTTILTPIDAAQGQANVGNTQARTGLAIAQTANVWANTGKVAADIQNDRQRTAAYISGVKGQYAVNMATVDNLMATTALKRASNPNDPLYNPVVAASKPGDPIDKLKKQAGVYYTQADQALKQANSLQTQIDSLTKQGTGISGAFDKTRLPQADQTKLDGLIKQRDNLMNIAINRRASGDKVVTDGMAGATNAAGGGTTETPFRNISAQPGVPLTGIKPALVKGIDNMLQNFTAPGGLRPVITEGVRTREQQAALYAKGRTAPGNIVTNAKPGTGLHESGTAVDISWMDPKTGKVLAGTDPRAQAAWKILGAQAPKYGLRWGGTFKTADGRPFVDMYHFEVATGGASAPQAAVPTASPAAFKANPSLEKNLASALQMGNRDKFDAVWEQLRKVGYSEAQITAVADAARK